MFISGNALYDAQSSFVNGGYLYFVAQTLGDYALYKIDITNTATFDGSSVSLAVAASGTASPDDVALIKNDGNILFVNKVSGVVHKYNYNSLLFDDMNLGGAYAKVTESEIQILDGSVIKRFDYSGNFLDSENIGNYGAKCSSSIQDNTLYDKVLITHCSLSEFLVTFRNNGTFIELSSFGMGWNPSETNIKQLYADQERIVMSFENIVDLGGGSYDIKSKVIQFHPNSSGLSFLKNTTDIIQFIPLNDGQYLTCEDQDTNSSNGDEDPSLVLYDFKNESIGTIEDEYVCAGSNDFNEFVFKEDGASDLKVILRKKDPLTTLGWELYNFKI